jgi:DNA-binding transcriptional LysR family regulator
MNLHKSMLLFVEVAQEGSLVAAGRKLGLSAPSASRLLGDLEEWLGQPLVRRSTRHLSLTELGESYLPRCREIVESTEALKRNAASQSKRPSGPLRVSAAGLHARRVVSAVIPNFLKENPDVTLQLETTNRFVDLMSEKVDLAIRAGTLEDSSLIARRICDFRTVLVASPEFLHVYGRPETPDDLLDLPCLIDTVPRHGGRWPFLGGKTVKGPVMINDGEIIRDLTIAGMGIAYLPGILVKDDIERGVLCELLTDVASETQGVYAVFPPRDYINPAARTFAQAIAEAFA